MAFFTQFENKVDKLKGVDEAEKNSVKELTKEFNNVADVVDQVQSKLNNLSSNSGLNQVKTLITEVSGAMSSLRDNANDLRAIETGVGNVTNSMEKLRSSLNVAMNFVAPDQVHIVNELAESLDKAMFRIETFGTKADRTRQSVKDFVEEVNEMARIQVGDAFNNGLSLMNNNISTLKTNLTEFISKSKEMNVDAVFTDGVKGLETTLTAVESRMLIVKDLQRELSQLQKYTPEDSDGISSVSAQLAQEAKIIQQILANTSQDVKALSEVCKDSQLDGIVSKIADGFSRLSSALPPELIGQFEKLTAAILDSFKAAESGDWSAGSGQATENLGKLMDMISGIADTSRSAQAAASGMTGDLKQSTETLAVDFVKMSQNALVFNTINDAIKNVTKSLDEGAESAKKLVASIDPSKLEATGLNKLFNDIDKYKSLMNEIKAANDQEGNVFINPAELARKEKTASQLRTSIGSGLVGVLSHGQEFGNQQELTSFAGTITSLLTQTSNISSIMKANLSEGNRGGEFDKQLQRDIDTSTAHRGDIGTLLRANEAKNIDKVGETITSMINGQNIVSPMGNLIDMASSQRAGTHYENSMRSAGMKSHDLAREAKHLQEEMNSDDSKYKWSEKRAMNKVMDIDSIATSAEDLSKLFATFEKAKGDFIKEVQEYLTTGKGDLPTLQAKALNMNKMQAAITGQADSLGRSVNVDNLDRKKYSEMSKDGQEFIRHLNEELGLIRNSSDAWSKFMERILDKEKLSEMEKFERSIDKVNSKITEGTQKTEGWAKTLTDVSSKGLNWASSLARGLGLGALAGGVGALLTGIPNEWSNMRRATANTAMVDYGMGADFNSAAAQDRIFTQGQKFYDMSHGMIGFEEMNNRYASMARQVGGGYGRTQNQGAADLNEINKETFALSKVYNVSDSTMNDAVKTFYKDLGMSASEATYTIHNLAQTAIASNIPVEKYMQTVSQLAQQYRSIGLDGKDAAAIMDRMLQSGMTLEQATGMTQATGGAMKNMANDKNSMAYFGMASGMFDDPFAAVRFGYDTHGANGKPRDGWGKTMAGLLQSEMDLYSDAAGGNENLRFMVVRDRLKQRGFTDEQASIGTNKLMQGDGFENWIEKEKPGDNQAQIVKDANAKLEKQIKDAADKLAGTDKVLADLNVAVRDLADKVGILIDSAVKPLSDMIRDVSGTISSELTKFKESEIWQSMVNGMGSVTKGLLALVAGMAVWKVLSSVFTSGASVIKAAMDAGSKLIKSAADTTVSAVNKLIAALDRNTRGGGTSADPGGRGRNRRGGRTGRTGTGTPPVPPTPPASSGMWSKILGSGSKMLKAGGITSVLGSMIGNAGEYIDDLSNNKEGATSKFLAGSTIDAAWAAPGAILGSFFGPLGTMAGGYATATLGEYVNQWTADKDGRGINDRMKSSLANMGSGSTLPVSEMDNNFGHPSSSSGFASLFGMSTASAAPTVNDSVRGDRKQIDAQKDQDTSLMTIMQGMSKDLIKPEEYDALLNKNNSSHAKVIDEINTRLANDAKTTKQQLHQDQLMKLANLSDSEKFSMKLIQDSVDKSSKDNATKLDEVIRAIYATKGTGSGITGMGGIDLGSGFGSLARYFESSGDPGAVTKNDAGTAYNSYGLYQLFGKPGDSLDKYLSELQKSNPDLYKQLSGAKPNTAEFDKAWKSLASGSSKEAFKQSQQDFAVSHFYGGLNSLTTNKLGFNANNRSNALREAMFAMSIQHGQDNAFSFFEEGLQGKDASKMGDQDIVKAAHEARMRWARAKGHSEIPRWEKESVMFETMYEEERKNGMPTNVKAPQFTAPDSGTKQMLTLAQVSDEDVKKWVKGSTQGLEPELLKRLAWMGKTEGEVVNITSGKRSNEEQWAIWNEHKRNNPNMSDDERRNYVAYPGSSAHESGGAVDINNEKLLALENSKMKQYGLYKPLWLEDGSLRTEDWHIETLERRGMQMASGVAPKSDGKLTAGQSQDDILRSRGINPDAARKDPTNPFATGSLMFHVLGSSYRGGKGINYDEIGDNLDRMGASRMGVNVNNQRLARNWREKYLKKFDSNGVTTDKPSKDSPVKITPIPTTETVKVDNKPADPYKASMGTITDYNLNSNDGNRSISIDFRMKTDGKSQKFVNDFEKVMMDFIRSQDVKLEKVVKEVIGVHNASAQTSQELYKR